MAKYGMFVSIPGTRKIPYHRHHRTLRRNPFKSRILLQIMPSRWNMGVRRFITLCLSSPWGQGHSFAGLKKTSNTWEALVFPTSARASNRLITSGAPSWINRISLGATELLFRGSSYCWNSSTSSGEFWDLPMTRVTINIFIRRICSIEYELAARH